MIDHRKPGHRAFGFWFCVFMAFVNFGIAFWLNSIPEVAVLAPAHIWFVFVFAAGAGIWWYLDKIAPPEDDG